eukprot:6076514-Lingulodinium_polyedra.AAC.1
MSNASPRRLRTPIHYKISTRYKQEARATYKIPIMQRQTFVRYMLLTTAGNCPLHHIGLKHGTALLR